MRPEISLGLSAVAALVLAGAALSDGEGEHPIGAECSIADPTPGLIVRFGEAVDRIEVSPTDGVALDQDGWQ